MTVSAVEAARRRDASFAGVLRRAIRRFVRAILRLLRHGPLRRRLSRIPFSPVLAKLFDGYEIVAWRGVQIALNPGEAHGHHVYFLGDYGKAEIDACIAQSHEGQVFVDVGANLGLMTLTVARACPKVSVVALEPDPVAAAWLLHNVSLNAAVAARIRVVEAAAASHDGTVRFQPGSLTGLNIGLGRIVPGAEADTQSFQVPTLALGPFAAREKLHLDVVKIDVEGGEADVLDGLFKGGCRPRAVLIETHGGMVAEPEAVFNQRIVDTLTSAEYGDLWLLSGGRWSQLRAAGELGARSHLLALKAAGTKPASSERQ